MNSFPLLTFVRIQVANFCNAEDDGSFWSRWIKPESVVTAEVRILSSIIISLCRRYFLFFVVCLNLSFSNLVLPLYRKLLHHGLLGVRRVMWILAIMTGAILTGLVKEERKDLSLQSIQIEVKNAEKLNILFLQLQY